ncbi:MAG: cyclic nucleotide-binding domain-containing protein [Polyangiales bacterium]
MSGKRDIIRRIKPFAALGDVDCDAILAVVKARRGNPNDVLFREGDPATSMLMVVEGALGVRVGDAEVARFGAGEVVGEMGVFDPASESTRSATIVARAPTLVLDFSREAISLLRRDAPFAAAALHRAILADVTRRLRDVNTKIDRVLDGGRKGSVGRPSMPMSQAARGKGPQLSSAQLRALPALREYGDADLELLSRATALRKFAPKEVLFDEGSIGDSCFLLLDGDVDVVRDHHGKVRVLSTLKAGALVGQLALVDRAPRSASVVANVQTHALELGKDVFDKLMQAQSALALRFQEQVAIAGIRQLRSATARLVALMAQRNEADAYMTGGQADSWGDEPYEDGGAVLELAIDPVSLRR